MQSRVHMTGISVLALILILMTIPSVIGQEQTEWSEIATEENFTFMLPSGWNYLPLDLDGNRIHNLVSEDYPNATFILSFMDTTNNENANEDAITLGLELFMQSASIKPIEGYNITFTDGAAETFGKDADNDIIHVVFVPGETRNTILMGSYKSLDEAIDADDTLREIALSVLFN